MQTIKGSCGVRTGIRARRLRQAEGQTDIIQEAIAAIAAQAADAQHERHKTITAIDTDLAEITEKIDRYLNAFENNTMTEAAAGERVA